jgi:hypothetical protein
MERRLGAMGSTSEKTISLKLQVRPGYKLALVNAPEGYKEKIARDLPLDASIAGPRTNAVDVIQIFVRSKRELQSNLPKIRSKLKSGGLVWVTYPKGTSTIKTDINRDVIRDYASRHGLETVAIFSVDSHWSALRLKVVRQ